MRKKLTEEESPREMTEDLSMDGPSMDVFDKPDEEMMPEEQPNIQNNPGEVSAGGSSAPASADFSDNQQDMNEAANLMAALKRSIRTW